MFNFPLNLDPFQVAGYAGTALLIGLSKTGVPGIGALIVPSMANIFPSRASTGILLPLLIAADVIAIIIYKKDALWPILLRMFPWTLVGIIFGWITLSRISDKQLRIVIGIIILVTVITGFIWNFFINKKKTMLLPNFFLPVASISAGFTTMLANAAGPVVTIFLVSINLNKRQFVGTSAWFYFVINLIKVPFSVQLGLISKSSLILNLIALPAILIGGLLGILILKKIPETVFSYGVQILALLAAINLFL